MARLDLKAHLVLSVMAALPFSVPGFAQDVAAKPEIYQPANEVEAKAQAVLDKHCARCHQVGKLVKKDRPAKGFGDTLQLDALAANPKRILPGNPDGSPLFQVIANKQMPYDLYQGGDFEQPSVTEEDLTALRNWIAAAGDSAKKRCKPGTHTYKSLVDLMYQDLGSLPESRRRNTRYISIAHLQAACASEEELNVYRVGVIRLLNSLSTNSDLVTLDQSLVGEDKLVVRFNLDDLNWTPQLWEEIVAHYPYAVRPFDSQYDALTQATSTQIPYVRGDWLAFFGARPLLYDKILNLPPTYQELEKQLGLDTFANIRNYLAKRSGFKVSGVSQHNRLIERHPISTGYFWTSYDFSGTKARQNLLQFPLGPKGVFDKGGFAYGNDFAFDHDGGETIFSLPNGYQGYYLNRADGKSLEKGPTEIVRDLARKDLAVTNGISCMGCHDLGMKNAVDDVRPHVSDNRLLSAEAREAVKALFPEKEEMNKIIEQDRQKFLTALKNSGVDPNLKHQTDGEPVNALSNRYERDVDLRSAAAEYGVPEDKIETFLRGGGPIGGSFAAQLSQGTVQRDIFEAEFANLVEFVVDGKAISPTKTPFNYAEVKSHEKRETPVSEFKLTLHSDKPSAKVGDPAFFTVKSTKDCFLTLINISGKDEGVIILPNKFSKDNFIRAGQTFVFPSEKDGYDFKFEDKGTETVIALCDVNGQSLPDVRPDYAADGFTKLGRSISVNKRIDNVKAPDAKKVKVSADGFAPDVARTGIKIKVN